MTRQEAFEQRHIIAARENIAMWTKCGIAAKVDEWSYKLAAMLAREALLRPRFQRQIGRDPDAHWQAPDPRLRAQETDAAILAVLGHRWATTADIARDADLSLQTTRVSLNRLLDAGKVEVRRQRANYKDLQAWRVAGLAFTAHKR
jgi:DNA-binding transcriptional ArsR family regulator